MDYSIRRMKSCLVFLHWLELVVCCWFFHLGVSNSADTLRVGQEMRDWEQLESSNGGFLLGFFSSSSSSSSPSSSSSSRSDRFLGIQAQEWYEPNGTKKMIWVANRANPLQDTSGVLKITQQGKLMLNDSRGMSITINSEQSYTVVGSRNITGATLDDFGNFVLRCGQHIVWQSFDHPSDVWLPGMKLGLFNLNSENPQHRLLTSWFNPSTSEPGIFTLGVDDPNNTKPQLVARRKEAVYWSSGSWNGYNFSFFSHNLDPYYMNLSYFSNENESYFTWHGRFPSVWVFLDSFGVLNLCYAAVCDQVVNCDPDQGDMMSKGCVRPKPSNCTSGDVFKKTRISMETSFSIYNFSPDLSDCREICRTNCSCDAYSYIYSSYGYERCSFYQGLNISTPEDFLYVRNNSFTKSESSTNTTQNSIPIQWPRYYSRKRQLWLIIGGPIASLLILASISLLCYLRWKNRCFKGGSNKDGIVVGMQQLMDELNNSAASIDELSNGGKLMLTGKKDHELPFVSLSTIEIATGYFFEKNKIGQGGYGPVYKGTLINGQEIAVKRLSNSSRQGLEEFKNEVILISRLQHRNLVKLLGCCMQKDERILIYEYLPNKSLDFFLFDAKKQYLLHWNMRVSIIGGIAQGLLYLHNYSRLRIIHRDLKTSNILLDKDMNPKISDFGTARIFGDNVNQANTNRIVGTLGYMSPEYAMDGLFSVKSDVFSFGVMMLEIISGKKNTSFYQPDRALNLLGYAWDLWKKAQGLELVDQALVKTYSTSEAMRYIQVGLLCVQEVAAHRPDMLDVMLMLTNKIMVLPTPKQPAFSKIIGVTDASTLKNSKLCSINNVTISELEVR